MKALQESFSQELSNMPSIADANPPGSSASNRVTKKIEKNLDNLKNKVLPAAIKNLEKSIDQKMQT